MTDIVDISRDDLGGSEGAAPREVEVEMPREASDAEGLLVVSTTTPRQECVDCGTPRPIGSEVVTAALHLPLTLNAELPDGPLYPPASEELTLRALQFQQACWDAGRPHRRDASAAKGMFDGDFEREDAAQTLIATAVRRPAEVEMVGVSVRPGGEVYGLARHTYRALLTEPLALENIPFMHEAAAAKFTAASLTQVSLRVRNFGAPHLAAVHTIERDTSFMTSPFNAASVKERADAAARPAPSPVPPANAVLQSPLKKRMAEIRDDTRQNSSGVSTPPPPTVATAAATSSARPLDPFAVAASVDPKRSWDPIKTPCSFRVVSCSSVDEAKWALSEQGAPYAYVQVPLSDPPVRDWVRVNSGHVDPDSVSGRVTNKVPLRSLMTVSCGNAFCVWGISEDSVDYGRCVARIGFTSDTPNGSDWINVSGGILADPPSASDRAQAALKRSKSLFVRSPASSSLSDADGTDAATSLMVIKTFQHVSVGWDGSVWAIVAESVVNNAEAAQQQQTPSSLELFKSSTLARTSVWVREGARGRSLGHRWTPLALSQEQFDFARPYELLSNNTKLKHDTQQFLQLHHRTFNEMFAIIAENADEHQHGYGHIYERCGITDTNITGDCWRKILLDATPSAMGLLTLPVDLRCLPEVVDPLEPTRVHTMSAASDGGVWAVNSKRQLVDCTASVARARAQPSSIILHDRFQGIPNHRDTTIDGELYDASRQDLTAMIVHFNAWRHAHQHQQCHWELPSEYHRSITTVMALLDTAALRTLFPNAETELLSVLSPSPHRKLFFVDVIEAVAPSSGPSYELRLLWQLRGAAVPSIQLSISTTPLVVFDTLTLSNKVSQVAETVRWEWTPAVAYVPPSSVISTAAGGTPQSRSIVSLLAGANIVQQLDATTPTLVPPLTAWLQFGPDSLYPSAATQNAVEYVESVVHRDICRDENAYDACNLHGHSLRQFKQVQTRRTVIRTKLMLCGTSRTVTVVSSVPCLGTPTPSVAVFCSDFPWAGENCTTLYGEGHDTTCPPLSASIAPMTSQPFLHRPDNFLFEERLRMLSSPVNNNVDSSSSSYSPSSTSRLFTDVLDLLDGCARSLRWKLISLVLSNESQMVFPTEHAYRTSHSVLQRRPDQQTREGRYRRVGGSDKAFLPSVSLRPGMSVITECPVDALLLWVKEYATSRSCGITAAQAELFEGFFRKAFTSSTEANTTHNTILLACNVSDSIAAAAAREQPVAIVPRRISLATKSLYGFDVLASLKRTYDAGRVSETTTKAQRAFAHHCVSMELLSPEYVMELQGSNGGGPSCSFAPYDTRQYASGPLHTNPATSSSSVSLKRATIQCTLRFHLTPPPLAVDDQDVDDIRQWTSVQLPPSFVANGEILLFDEQSSPSAAAPCLTFRSRDSSIVNWTNPGNIGSTTILSGPSVEAVFRHCSSDASTTTTTTTSTTSAVGLDDSYQLVALRFTGQGTTNGNLFEFGTLEYPVLQGGPSAHCGGSFMNAFGPCSLRVQRRVLPFSELVRGSSAVAAAAASQEDHDAPRIVEMTRRGVFMVGALDAAGCRFIDAEYIAAGPSTLMTHALLPSNVVRLPRQGSASPDMPLPPFRAVPSSIIGNDRHDGIILSNEAIRLFPALPSDSPDLSRVLCFDEAPVDNVNDIGDYGEQPPELRVSSLVAQSSKHQSMKWTMVKRVCNATNAGGGDGPQFRSTLQDPVLRFGDRVLLVDPDSGNCVGNGWEGANESGFLWVLQSTNPNVDCWTALRQGQPFMLISAAPPGAYDGGGSGTGSSPIPSIPTFLRKIVVPAESPLTKDAPNVLPLLTDTITFALHIDGVDQWVASSVTAHSALSLDASAAIVFGQHAVATAIAAAPPMAVASLPDAPPSSRTLVNVSGYFSHPLTFGDRPYNKTAVIALQDVNDHSRGCAFEIVCAEQQQQAEGSTIRFVHDVTFRLRDAAISFLGATMPCSGSSLNDGAAGIAMGDVVLHAVASWRVPPTPRTFLGSAVAHEQGAVGNSETCSHHGGALDIHVSLEVPLVRKSLLVDAPPTTLSFPRPPCDGGDAFFQGDASTASPTLLGEFRCAGCVAHLEGLLRAAIHAKADNAPKQFDLVRLTAELKKISYEVELQQRRVHVQMNHHADSLQPVEDAANAEVSERMQDLKSIIKRQEVLEEKINAKPHKAAMYELEMLLLQELRHQADLALRAAQTVHRYQSAALGGDIAAISEESTTLSRLRSQAAEVTYQLNSARRLNDVATSQGQAAIHDATSAPHGSCVSNAVAWALRSVRLHGSRNPASEMSAATASMEFEFEVSRRAQGTLGAGDPGYAAAISSLSLLNPTTATTSPTPQQHYFADTTRGQQVAHAATQTTEVVVFHVPFDVTDVSHDCAMPLKTMANFTALVVNPIASRLVRDVLGSALQTQYGLAAEELSLMSGASLTPVVLA